MPNEVRLQDLRSAAAIVGIGETAYRDDYALVRAGTPRTDAYGYAAAALRGALDDAGLRTSDIDGLIAGPALASERLGEVLGINPRWADQADAANAVAKAAQVIHAGLAETVALVYGNDQRAVGTRYGGPGAMGTERHLAYSYFAPWGLTSQGALYALMANRYMAETGLTGEQLGAFVASQRAFAQMNPNAIMTKPLSVDDYLQSREICTPLRLFDYCLINDGGVALIVTSAERASDFPAPPVYINALARSDMNSGATTLEPRLLHYYHPAHREAARQAYAMADLGPGDIDSVQIYDSFSIHIPVALEGFGFCDEGAAGLLAESGATAPGGSLPVNTSGGHLSESYMQGWNHQVEAVRQVRGQAGTRQVPNTRNVQYISDVAGKVMTIIYGKEPR
ncbi:thiolase family protein [Nocardia sp. NBC_00416]|uniref:thiolase family protein n=1 Tax=Nocardia sp. NBC_00416 TaxID=2975991 RepID=UPI002E247F88